MKKPAVRRKGANNRNGINDKVREFLVVAAARYLTPSQAAIEANEHFGLTLDRRDANRYNPERQHSGKNISRRWHELFAAARKRHLDSIDAIPIANRSMRLQQLNTLYFAALERRDYRHAAELLERAAKEAGNVHSNHVKVEHSGAVKVEEVTEDEMRARIADALAEAWEKKPPAATAH